MKLEEKEYFKHSLAQVFRAISEDDGVEIDFPLLSLASLNESYFDKRDRILNLNLPEKLNKKNIALCRAEVDFYALKIRYHDEKIFLENKGNNEEIYYFLKELEQIRLQAIGAKKMLGTRNNFKRRFYENYKNTDLNDQNLIYYISFTKLIGDLELGRFKQKDKKVKPALKKEIEKLNDFIFNQKEFTKQSKKIAEFLFHNIDFKEKSKKDQDIQTIENQKFDELREGESDEKLTAKHASDEEDRKSAEESNGKLKQKSLVENNGEGIENGGVRNDLEEGNNYIKKPSYKIFTTKYDQIIEAAHLADAKELSKLRGNLEQNLQKTEWLTKKLTSILQQKLLAKQKRSWQFGLEEGILDGRKLPQIITDPNYQAAYKVEKKENDKDTIVILLIDNSGSMRGRPITTAATSVDIITRTLENCRVKTEILGFTTKNWRGGEARKLWQEHAEPKEPGRLNDLLHIIYKNANNSWRQSKNNLGLMLKDGLLKENIDGEALLWARSRLLRRNEERKILMVISDGAPVDDSTLSVNNKYYLDFHLRDVIKNIDNDSGIELLAIGIGHDVTKYYQNSVMIENIDSLANTMIEELGKLFD